MPVYSPTEFEAPQDTQNITSPYGNAIASALKTYHDLTAAQQGNLDLEAKGYENQINKAKAGVAVPMAQAELTKAQAEPGLIQAQTIYQQALAKGVPSEIAQRMAQSALVKQQTYEQQIKNQFLGEREQAEIGEKKAQAKYYNQGGSGGMGGVGSKDQMHYNTLVALDNPHLRPDQQTEAQTVLAHGGKTLKDGTLLNPLSFDAQQTLNRIIKSGSTAELISKGVTANQAETEMPVYSKYINEGVAPYGTTTFGVSPQQIKDSLDVQNHAAQDRLGKYMAAQLLIYDRAALSLKINALPPGVTLADEIAKLSNQTIKAKFPRMSAESRQIAADTVQKALSEGLAARNAYGVGAAGATGLPPAENSEPQPSQAPQMSAPTQVVQSAATPEQIKILPNGTEVHKIGGKWYPVVRK